MSALWQLNGIRKWGAKELPLMNRSWDHVIKIQLTSHIGMGDFDRTDFDGNNVKLQC